MGQFVYRRPSKETVKQRATQKGGQFDSYLKQEFETFSPKEGDVLLRLIPSDSPDVEHYGIDVWVHSGVGANNDSYLCKEKMQKKRCVLCEEHSRALKDGDTDYANELKPYRRVLAWVIDRNEEKVGPQLYAMPWTLDRDIMARSVDKKTNEMLYVDHPEEGFDIEFRREGKGMKTKYVAIGIARRSSPLCDDQKTQDKWLDFVHENPLPSVLNYYDDEYVQKVFDGKPDKDKKRGDDAEAPRTRHEGESRSRREEEPRRRDETPAAADTRDDRRRDEDPPRRREVDDANASLDDAPKRRDEEPAPRSRRDEAEAPRSDRRTEADPEPRRRDESRDAEPRSSRRDDDNPPPRRRDEPPAEEPRRRTEEPAPRSRRDEAEVPPRRTEEPAPRARRDDDNPRRRDEEPQPRGDSRTDSRSNDRTDDNPPPRKRTVVDDDPPPARESRDDRRDDRRRDDDNPPPRRRVVE